MSGLLWARMQIICRLTVEHIVLLGGIVTRSQKMDQYGKLNKTSSHFQKLISYHTRDDGVTEKRHEVQQMPTIIVGVMRRMIYRFPRIVNNHQSHKDFMRNMIVFTTLICYR